MKELNIKEVTKKYKEGLSCAEIAEQFSTYPKKIVTKKAGSHAQEPLRRHERGYE